MNMDEITIVVWKDGTWKPGDAGFAWEAHGDPDFLVAIPLKDIQKVKAECDKPVS
jgi:hypothetical protein